MRGMRILNGVSDLRPQFSRRPSGSFFLIEAWMPSETKAIFPLVNRLMRLTEGSRCVAGNESDVELPLREALNNAVVHGNRMDAHKLVQGLCRCASRDGIFLVVKDQRKDSTRMRFPIPRVPKISAPTTGVASG
jgi:hypothetical protein